MIEKKIVSPSGKEYMTAVYQDGKIKFKNFGASRMIVQFDANVLEQLLPFLKEAHFWHRASTDNVFELEN